jgi:hypothetical protein
MGSSPGRATYIRAPLLSIRDPKGYFLFAAHQSLRPHEADPAVFVPIRPIRPIRVRVVGTAPEASKPLDQILPFPFNRRPDPRSVVRYVTDTAHLEIMIRKLKSGEYRLYSRKIDPKTGRRRNLGTFKSRAAAEKHEKAVQFFKRRG